METLIKIMDTLAFIVVAVFVIGIMLIGAVQTNEANVYAKQLQTEQTKLK